MDTNKIDLVSLPTLTAESLPFLAYLQQWVGNLPAQHPADVFAQPVNAAVISVDMIQGFCNSGALSSPRVGAIVPPVVRLMQAAYDQGVRNFALTQDTHEPDAVEFGSWPAHCVRGTEESEAVLEIRSLPFYHIMQTFPKNSINSAANTGLRTWIEAHPQVDTFVIVGDCTDLCVYQMAMDLRTDANARQLQRRVIVPANAVDTYDLPVETAQAAGILPHPAELLHALFLYHMALNGIEVVRAIEAE
jgi:nicotinamidase-related amidase